MSAAALRARSKPLGAGWVLDEVGQGSDRQLRAFGDEGQDLVAVCVPPGGRAGLGVAGEGLHALGAGGVPAAQLRGDLAGDAFVPLVVLHGRLVGEGGGGRGGGGFGRDGTGRDGVRLLASNCFGLATPFPGLDPAFPTGLGAHLAETFGLVTGRLVLRIVVDRPAGVLAQNLDPEAGADQIRGALSPRLDPRLGTDVARTLNRDATVCAVR